MTCLFPAGGDTGPEFEPVWPEFCLLLVALPLRDERRTCHGRGAHDARPLPVSRRGHRAYPHPHRCGRVPRRPRCSCCRLQWRQLPGGDSGRVEHYFAAVSRNCVHGPSGGADINGATATLYAGTIHFTSTDTKAVLPADYTFTSADQG